MFFSPGHREDGEFEVVTSRPRMMDNLPLVQRQEPLCQLVIKIIMYNLNQNL